MLASGRSGHLFLSAEAIQNAIKHAGERRSRGGDACGATPRRCTFAVADDGVGMDPADKRAGDGLTGMRDRIGAVGGTIDIVSSPGHGTTVRGTVPVDEPHPSDTDPVAHPA